MLRMAAPTASGSSAISSSASWGPRKAASRSPLLCRSVTAVIQRPRPTSSDSSVARRIHCHSGVSRSAVWPTSSRQLANTGFDHEVSLVNSSSAP